MMHLVWFVCRKFWFVWHPNQPFNVRWTQRTQQKCSVHTCSRELHQQGNQTGARFHQTKHSNKSEYYPVMQWCLVCTIHIELNYCILYMLILLTQISMPWSHYVVFMQPHFKKWKLLAHCSSYISSFWQSVLTFLELGLYFTFLFFFCPILCHTYTSLSVSQACWMKPGGMLCPKELLFYPDKN